MSSHGGFLTKLSEESLTRPPEEVFDILGKIGEGSYGAVFKAMLRESGHLLAIKTVPVDTDLQEIIKEISIMQQCDSPYVVRYFGSYFKDTDLWIVMEYCGAGSVSDIIKRRNRPLTEQEIAVVLGMTLKGLEYLHFKRKIHRDIKAGNILLNTEGQAKLADFGVAGQLTDTMAKRNTVIGTPFWMAPEVIQDEDEEEDDELDTGTTRINGSDSGTMIALSSGDSASTTTTDSEMGTMISRESDGNTMVINSSDDEFAGDTMRRMDTLHLAEETETDNKDDYRPAFMDHFDRADDRAKTAMKGNDATESSPARQTAVAGAAASPQKDWKRSHTDFDYLKTLSVEELQCRLTNLDPEMERELEELRQRYQIKRKPILDAVNAKKKQKHKALS